MSHRTPKEIISRIHEIGSLPQSLAAVLKIINDPNSDAESIANVISKDVSLTSRVLKMVNSASYSRHGKVTKISEAVMVMGLNSIRMLALSSSVFGMIPESGISHKFDIRRIWRHLIETASASKYIASLVHYKEPEEAFVAGILHDVGIIIMLLYFGEEYIDLIDQAVNSRVELPELEKETFGFNHSEIGAELVESFNLPQSFIYITLNHHNLESESEMPEETELNYIIALADRLALGPYDQYYPDMQQNIEVIRQICDEINIQYSEIENIRKISLMQSIILSEYLDLDVSNILELLTEAKAHLADMYYSVETLYKVKEKLYGEMPENIKQKLRQKV
jgi:putative nucleotidyltransferase with HDIG domain